MVLRWSESLLRRQIQPCLRDFIAPCLLQGQSHNELRDHVPFLCFLVNRMCFLPLVQAYMSSNSSLYVIFGNDQFAEAKKIFWVLQESHHQGLLLSRTAGSQKLCEFCSEIVTRNYPVMSDDQFLLQLSPIKAYGFSLRYRWAGSRQFLPAPRLCPSIVIS